MSIPLALGQIEEAMGLLEDAGTDATPRVYEALALAREYLALATASPVARVPVAHYTPITAEEVERQS